MEKKRLRILIPMLLLLPLLVWGFSYLNLASPALDAEGGRADLQAPLAEEGPYMLGGRWEILDEASGVYRLMEENIRYARRMEGNTYRFIIDAPADTRFLLPRPHNSRLWINGREALGESGASIRSSDIFRLGDYGQGRFVCTLQVAGSTPYYGYQGMLLGSYDQIARIQARWMVLDILALGLEAMLILICLALFINKPSERYLLFLALCAAANALHFMLVPRHPLLSGFGIGNAVVYRALVFLYYIVCREFLHGAISRRVDIVMLGAVALSTAALLLFPGASSPIIRAASIFYLCVEGYCIGRGILLRIPEAPIIMAGNAAALSNELFYALIDIGIIPYGLLDVQIMPAQYAIVAYIIAFAIATCYRFARKFEEADRLSLDLEQRVISKTSELQAANSQILEIQEQKEKFMTGVIHNLRNPLFALGGYIDLLQDEMGAGTPDQKHYLHLIDDKITYLSKMSYDLLLASKLEEGKLEYHFTEYDLRALMHSAAQDAMAKTSSKSVDIIVDCPSIRLIADQYSIRQMLDNLLDNAVRYSEDGGRIEMTATPLEGERVRLSVKDFGAGIDPQLLGDLFHKRLHSRPGSNTGYGLYIVGAMAKAHGGHVAVESEPGVVTEFTVTLPLRPVHDI